MPETDAEVDSEADCDSVGRWLADADGEGVSESDDDDVSLGDGSCEAEGVPLTDGVGVTEELDVDDTLGVDVALLLCEADEVCDPVDDALAEPDSLPVVDSDEDRDCEDEVD